MRWMREPLVHFLLLGLALFGLYAVIGQGRDEGPQKAVVVTAQDVAWLRESWQRQRNRPPTQDELRGLVDDFIREEILYREAVSLGLDQDDMIVRRRMAQKMEFLFTDLSELRAPTDVELLAYFETNRERYAEPARVSFSHIYFNPDLRGARTDEDARALLEELPPSPPSPESMAQLGDPLMLQPHYADRTKRDIHSLFGSEFADVIAAMEPGQWTGPIRSGYGVHLVYVQTRSASQPAELAQVRERVLVDFSADRRSDGKQRYYEQLRTQYDVKIEPTELTGQDAS